MNNQKMRPAFYFRRAARPSVIMLLLTLLLAGCGESASTATITSGQPTLPATSTVLPTPTTLPASTTQPTPTALPVSSVITTTGAISTAPVTSNMQTTSTPPVFTPSPAVTEPAKTGSIMLVTNSTGREVSFVDPQKGVIKRLDVGAAPWAIALTGSDRAFITTAEGVAVVDTRAQTLVKLVPYQSPVGPISYGEYRAGGMGIAASPDGKQIYTGVYLLGQQNRLEIMDTEKLTVVGSVPIGIRPFEVMVSRDGKTVYSLDHDSFTVTAIDPVKLIARTLEVAPLGKGAFDKPHYAAFNPTNGHLLMPVQGRVLLDFDPEGRNTSTIPLKSNTHQHGVTLSADGTQLFIVGTGPAGEVNGGPNLSIVNLVNKTEEIIPLARPHEKVAISPDGTQAYLTGGYTFANGGWDGLTVIDLKTRATREILVPNRPLDIVFLPAG